MKTKNLFFGVLAVASLASCSEDKVLGVSPGTNGEEITYSVRSNKMTRASDLYNNDNKPASFYVWAATADGTYIDGDKITGSGDTYTDEGGTHYWPSDNGSLDFYATNYENASLDLTSAPTIAYTVETNPADQEDLLYAVATGQTSEINEGTVNLNFRHALSQIVFKAVNENSGLYVKITGVGVYNVYNQGTFTFPTVSTAEHQESTASYLGDGTADWSTTTGDNDASYTISLSDVTLAGATTTLTSGETALLLLPQEIALPDGANHLTDGVAYLTLDCAVYNVAGTTYDAETDEQLWGVGGETARTYFPLAINWEAGKRYTYTFNFSGFGTGEGGENGSNGEDEEGNSIISAITYSVTVDEFVETDAGELDIETDGEDSSTGNGEDSSTGNEEDSSTTGRDFNGHEYVDLGLPSGLLWATCNVGASSETDYGNYYAWGEIEPKDEYTSSNSTWYSNTTVTVDDIKGNPLYDAARANWGGTWRLPTSSEIDELINNTSCKFTTKTVNGNTIHYATLTGPNGNTITFPQPGYINGTTHTHEGDRGFWWSCSPYNARSAAYLLRIVYDTSINDNSTKERTYEYKYIGETVRPVTDY